MAEKRTARIAGLWYLAFILLGMFSIMFVDEKLSVPGDMATTMSNIHANEILFRFGFVACLAGYVCFLLLVNTLRKIFEPVSGSLAKLMNAFVLVGVSMAFVCRVAGFTVIDMQDGDIAATLYSIQTHGEMAAEIFWGLWLLPLGVLIIQSKLIPKTIGVLLVAACAGQLIDFFVYFLVPSGSAAVQPILYVIGAIGEFSLMLWLLVKGVNSPKQGGKR